MKKDLEPIRAIIDTPLEGQTPTNFFAARIGNPDGNGGWNFGVGDPEFWKFSQQLLVPGGNLLDLGIGSGRTSLSFALQGMTVTGYDTSPRAVARLRGLVNAYPFLPIEVRQEDIVSAELGHEKFDTVILGQTFIHFPSKELAYAVLDKAVSALKPEGHLWIRTAGKEASLYEEMQEAAKYGFDGVKKIDDDVFMNECGCSGEFKVEPQLFFGQTELLQYFTQQGFKIVHSQLIPEPWELNIMYGKDWNPGADTVKGGAITIIAQKRK